MSICINPDCLKSQNPDTKLFCQSCGSELLLEGRYRVIRVMGGGGFSKTLEVSDHGISKVLKVLTINDPKAISLFQQEAKVLSQLNHPGIPKVDGYFTCFSKNSQTPLHCLVMEKIEGLDLEEYLQQRRNRPIDEKLAISWLTQLAKILYQVHQQNFFHRDIKPSNIMLRPDGRLVLIDFGTAREITGTYVQKVAAGQNVTGIVSTGYTPQEQATGKAVPQSDFFALGRTFVYLLTGKSPDEFPEDPRTGKLIGRDSALPVSRHLAGLIDYLMAPFPGKRPQNTQMILQCIAEINQTIQQSQSSISASSIPPTVIETPHQITQSQKSTNAQTKSSKTEAKTSPAKAVNSAYYAGIGILLATLLRVGIPAIHRHFESQHSQPDASPTPTQTEQPNLIESTKSNEPSGASLTSEPSPIFSEHTSLSIPDGWKKIEGNGVELLLPNYYQGGDPNRDSAAIAQKLSLVASDYQRRLESFRQIPFPIALVAFDSQLDSVRLLTNVSIVAGQVPIGTTVEQYLLESRTQLLSMHYRILEQSVERLNQHQTGRIVTELMIRGVRSKQLFYAIFNGNTFWVVTYSASANEFARQLPVFEQSIRTFAVHP